MGEEEIIKLIKSKSQAVAENLLLTPELTKIKEQIEKFLDQNLKGDGLLSLRYRKFKLPNKQRTLWSDTSGFPIGGENWIKPYIDFFEQYITEKKIVNRLEDEKLWVESRTRGNEQHLLIGDKQNDGQKVHLVFGETGEIRIDKKDQPPAEVFRKVESVLTKSDGDTVKSTLEFFRDKVD
ncbi:MAG: hypothetical protein KGJ89_01675 [Patescibacteria group bacterium]|nr:hypothetical protein [Patescibacteria group bacterium]MDE2015587.1 hypothetical protein [Patescibacteria group bacterium]MDE2226645.1 hypothetical protein [Patescibacteria group bacterium]